MVGEKIAKKCKKYCRKIWRIKKVRIFAARLRNNGKFIDKFEKDNEVSKEEEIN